MKRGIKEWAVRVVILLVGLCIAHLGVTLFLLSDLGSDPFNVFVQGLFRTGERIAHGEILTHGRTHVAVSLLIVLILRDLHLVLDALLLLRLVQRDIDATVAITAIRS